MKLYDYEREHIKALRKLNAECTVLLKKDGSFPLDKAGDIALFGSGARNTLKGGTGSGEVNSHYFVTVEKGLKNAGFNITSTEWMNSYEKLIAESKKIFYKGIKKEARKAKQPSAIFYGMGKVMPEPEYEFSLDYPGDACVYVLSRICGEGNDRAAVNGDIFLSETEIRDINALNEKFEKFILVLNVGGPVDLSPVENVKNILILSQLGVDTGNILAAILLGKAYPSGKLTTTWAKWEDYQKIGEFGEEVETRYNEGIYVGYRYFDSVGKKAAYPFGFGLGYTEFELSGAKVSVDGSLVKASVNVKNIGSFKGMEVAQMYISSPAGKLDKPYQSLAAFAKTKALKPGSSEKLELVADLKDIASYDEASASYILEKGSYIIRIGNSSVNTVVAGCVAIDKTTVVKQVKNVLGKPDFEDWKPECIPSTDIAGIRNIHVKADAITAETVSYDPEYAVLLETDEFSDEELARVNVGAFSESHDIASIIGSAGKNVAGAAGETTSYLKDKDVPPIIMADGPAGLRLSKNYVITDEGQRSADPPLANDVKLLMNPAEKLAMKIAMANVKGEIHHHYATAIPIGTAIAQSWNIALAETCGDIVGDEMERAGVQLWLAPALNIHRDIRCGRNFEYYSEDPLISGKFAAAITRGVQKHPGRATTIKHYAANNQELNRYNNNSQVSERAMREIYLKGFEICVRESQPRTLMTSYNLLNTVHTAQHRGLIEDILRAEYGFEGVVMTDWTISNGMMGVDPFYPAPEAYKVVAAGNDLFMPGSIREVDNIKQALSDGTLDRRQLQINATRVINLARELNSFN